MHQEFYDQFFAKRMLSYRITPNPRISMATHFVLSHVERTSRVLDIGCGIGLVAEQVARKARAGKVWACDLSSQNVWYASRTVKEPNAEFFVSDVVTDFGAVRARLGSPVDVITMIDVLEHLPRQEHLALLSTLGEISTPDARLVLTFPSAEYNRYLRDHEPEELQPVDEELPVAVVAATAEAAGWKVLSLRHVDVWRRNQYVHCALARTLECPTLPAARPSLLARATRPVTHALERILQARRRRRYVDDVFEDGR